MLDIDIYTRAVVYPTMRELFDDKACNKLKQKFNLEKRCGLQEKVVSYAISGSYKIEYKACSCVFFNASLAYLLQNLYRHINNNTPLFSCGVLEYPVQIHSLIDILAEFLHDLNSRKEKTNDTKSRAASRSDN